MTRVNLVDPKVLIDQHLLAEYREIPRIITLAKRSPSIPPKGAPDRYVLGTGHMKFFYDKTRYICYRHNIIHQELTKRGFSPNFGPLKTDLESIIWIPSADEIQTNVERLVDRLITIRNVPRFYKMPITYAQAEGLLKDYMDEEVNGSAIYHLDMC